MNKFVQRIKKAAKGTKLKEEKFDNQKIFSSKNLNLIDEFKEEFLKVSGEFFQTNSKNETAEALENIIKKNNLSTVITLDNKIISLMNDYNFSYSTDIEKIDIADVSINTCEYLAASTGSIIVSSTQKNGRKLNVFVPNLIIIANKNQLLKNLDEVLDKLKEKYQNKVVSLISVITGPSRTADIEKTLILGMHGPKKVMLIYQNY